MPEDADDADAMVMSAILPSQEAQAPQDTPADPSTLDGHASTHSLSSEWEEDDDAMDMTPDPPTQPPLSAAEAAVAAAADAAAAAALVASAPNNNSVSSIETNPHPGPAPYETAQPPPPAPAASSVGPSAANDTSEDSTSDDEYDEEYDEDMWHDIAEDTSAPEPAELASIKDERSALDHAYFESKLVQSFEDPEYAVADTGRIEWAIDHFNGTRDNPNKELLMKSPIVSVGGFEWQIKFYPRGNGSDQLGVYLECLNFVADDFVAAKPESRRSSRRKSCSSTTTQKSPDIKPPPVEYQSTPLAMLDPTPIPRRSGVTADLVMVLYNPAEPRVFVSKSCRHRYSASSTDWGWIRYHGPWFEIGHRVPGQRQALLRDDKLAFTAYIRTVDDLTGSLWEHPNKDSNPWDCFNMTGMQGLTMDHITPASYVPAVASWLHLRPFREILYAVTPPDAFNEQHTRPKPLLAAFQRVLFDLRVLKQKSPKNWRPPVSVKPILQAMNEIGLASIVPRCDVVETWGIMRRCLEKELSDTPQAGAMKKLFGPLRDRSTNKPITRLPIKSAYGVQNAINSSPGFMAGEAPVLLQVELDRQHFETSTRTWKKLTRNIKLDEYINLHGRGYTLYGYIGHRGDLKSSNFCAVLRPNGPKTGWFVFNDRRFNAVQETDRVLFRIPQSMAKDGSSLFGYLDRYEGVDKYPSIENTPVAAYVVLYLRDDHIGALDASNEPAWNPPNWIRQTVLFKRELESQLLKREMDLQSSLPSLVVELPTNADTPKEGDKFEFVVRAINSDAFRDHVGSGMANLHDLDQLRSKGHLITFTMDGRATSADFRKQIASLREDIQDPKQIRFWPIDSIIADKWINLNVHTSESRPFHTVPRSMRTRVIQRWMWYHVDEVPPQAKVKTETEPKSNGSSAESAQVAEDHTVDPPAEDTIMSEAEDDDRPLIPPPQRAVPQQRALSPPAAEGPSESNAFRRSFPPGLPPSATINLPPGIPPPPAAGLLMETLMPGSSSLFGSMPPPAAATAGASDTNAGPPPAALPPPIAPPPAGSRGQPPAMKKPPPTPRDIYFFLKRWHPDEQQLKPIGFFLTRSNSRLDNAITKALPGNVTTKLFRQVTHSFVERVKGRKTFDELLMQNGTVIVISEPSTMDANTLLEKGFFQEIGDYLEATCMDLCWPHQSRAPAMTYDMFGHTRYDGPVLAHRAHGDGGTMQYLNGDRYSGGFALGQRHGRGTMHFANGDTYEGEWARDQQDGRGRYVDGATQNVYEGGWRENRRRGEGVTHWKRAEEGEKMCRVCWEEPAEAAFYDCGHVVACVDCARRVQVCPVCRKKVLSALKLFFVA